MKEHPHPDSGFYAPEAETEIKRRDLPHWRQGSKWCFVNWRLADSVPAEKSRQWREEKGIWLESHPTPWDEKTEDEFHRLFSTRLEKWLDKGAGSCVLRDPKNARIMANALHFFDGERYGLAAYAVMPNHVHVLFRPMDGHVVSDVLKSWKGFSAHEINKRMGVEGTLWQPESWDRLIRNERHFFRCAEYIRNNPVMAGLRDGFVVWSNQRGAGIPACGVWQA